VVVGGEEEAREPEALARGFAGESGVMAVLGEGSGGLSGCKVCCG
jgi:hypothetical protein